MNPQETMIFPTVMLSHSHCIPTLKIKIMLTTIKCGFYFWVMAPRRCRLYHRGTGDPYCLHLQSVEGSVKCNTGCSLYSAITQKQDPH